MRCYDASEQSVEAAVLLKSAPSDPRQLAQRVTAARDFATRCVQRNGDLLEHLSTANVARDLDPLRQAGGDRQMTYDGISCGTYLRATYPALFPRNVRAMVVDGEFDAPDYRVGGRTPFLRSNGPEGAWATLQQFFQLCAAADAARCALAADGDPAQRFDQLVARVRQQPITLASGDVIEYGTLLAATFTGLFFADQWSASAQLLQDVYAARLGPAAQRLQSLSQAAADSAYDNTQEGQLASVRGDDQSAATGALPGNRRSGRPDDALRRDLAHLVHVRVHVLDRPRRRPLHRVVPDADGVSSLGDEQWLRPDHPGPERRCSLPPTGRQSRPDLRGVRPHDAAQ